jgi:lipopolysaccharide export system protein LptA
MTNLGSPKSTKEHARISGNVVIATATLASGAYLTSAQIVSVSGNVVQVAGGVTISGDAVTISGNVVYVYISGGTFCMDISGQTMLISGTVDVIMQSGAYFASGQIVTVSGNWVDISGNSVFVYISGGTFCMDISGQTLLISGTVTIASGAYFASGQSVMVSGNAVTVSGNWVDISGAVVKISGETVIAKVSGEVVGVVLEVVPSFGYMSGSSGDVVSSYLESTMPTFLQYVEYHASAAGTESSALTVYKNSTQGHSSAIFTYSTLGVVDLVYTPPDSPLMLLSGDGISVRGGNSGNAQWNTLIVMGK